MQFSAAFPPTLTVVYSAFVNWFPIAFTTTFDTQSNDGKDLAAAAGVRDRFRFVPQAGYNHSLQTYGGLQAEFRTIGCSVEA